MGDDRPGVDEALAIIRSMALPLGVEQLPLREALGRTLAEPAVAAINVPRFVASAMDGYAVAAADCATATFAAPMRLPVVGTASAGNWPDQMRGGSAVPISTGAPMPEGTDTVIVREDARLVDGCLSVSVPPMRYANVRQVGEDMAVGREVAARGTRMTADAVGALMACGVEIVAVWRRPAVRLFTTGSELAADAGALADPSLIIDSNGPMIAAFALDVGLKVEFIGRAVDDARELDAMLAPPLSADAAQIVISSGGVSHGTHDLVRERLERAGATVHFHGIRMRPGKPLLFATLADGRLYFGLPGTPVAAFVAMRFFVMEAVRAMTGLDPEAGVPVDNRPAGRPGTTMFLRGSAGRGVGGAINVDTTTDQRSHVLSNLIQADAWLRVEAGRALYYPKLPERL